jgi:hypothetical protein
VAATLPSPRPWYNSGMEEGTSDQYIVVVTRGDGVVVFGTSVGSEAEAIALKAQYNSQGHTVTIVFQGKPLERP